MHTLCGSVIDVVMVGVCSLGAIYAFQIMPTPGKCPLIIKIFLINAHCVLIY